MSLNKAIKKRVLLVLSGFGSFLLQQTCKCFELQAIHRCKRHGGDAAWWKVYKKQAQVRLQSLCNHDNHDQRLWGSRQRRAVRLRLEMHQQLCGCVFQLGWRFYHRGISNMSAEWLTTRSSMCLMPPDGNKHVFKTMKQLQHHFSYSTLVLCDVATTCIRIQCSIYGTSLIV